MKVQYESIHAGERYIYNGRLYVRGILKMDMVLEESIKDTALVVKVTDLRWKRFHEIPDGELFLTGLYGNEVIVEFKGALYTFTNEVLKKFPYDRIQPINTYTITL